jgi:hypothetical protein
MYGRLFKHVTLAAVQAGVAKIQPTLILNISVHVNILRKVESLQKALF